MKIHSLHIGMEVRHPQYGLGIVKAITETSVDVLFGDARRTVAPEESGLQAAAAQVSVTGLDLPLSQVIQETVASLINQLGLEKPEENPPGLASKWHKGNLVLHPADPTKQSKEVPLETFFHKIVGMRNQLRIIEQKINAHDKLSEGEKIDMQQYITRCYGSMTTFNVLFKEKEDQF